MRYLPFIFISFILYALFFYNSQEPEQLIVSSETPEKVIPIDFNLSVEKDNQPALLEEPHPETQSKLEKKITLQEERQSEEKQKQDESTPKNQIALAPEALKENSQAQENRQQLPPGTSTQIIASSTSVDIEKNKKPTPTEALTTITNSEQPLETVSSFPITTVKSSSTNESLNEPNSNNKKEIVVINGSIDSAVATESALLKGELFQRNLLVNLPPLPKKKKVASTQKTATKKNTSPKEKPTTVKNTQQVSVSNQLLQGNQIAKKQASDVIVKEKTEKPKRTFKKQITSTPNTTIPGLQVAIAVSGNKPQYPEKAKSEKLQGTVTAQFTVNIQGKTKNSQIINSSTHKILDDALLEFVDNERFMPALDGIEKVTSEQQLSFKYEIQ